MSTTSPWREFPPLVAVAHGSRDSRAKANVRKLLELIRQRRPGLRVSDAYVELTEPSFSCLTQQLNQPPVVIPLLLSRGYHLYHDVYKIAEANGFAVSRALGPDELLIEVMENRLVEAGMPRGIPTILAAAGSLDSEGISDVTRTAALLQKRLGASVTPAFIGTSFPNVAQAIELLNTNGNCAVATYLLSPGRFSTSLSSSRAKWIAKPLGSHPLVVDLILRRYDEAAIRHGLWSVQSEALKEPAL